MAAKTMRSYMHPDKVPNRVNNRSPYPRFFMTPEGRAVSIKTMGAALRAIRANPDADYPGWNWFLTSGHMILQSFRDGMHDRINLRVIGRRASQSREERT